MRLPRQLRFTYGDFVTIVISPSKLSVGFLVAQLTAYTTGDGILEWPIVGILCGIPYLTGVIRYFDSLEKRAEGRE